MLSRRPTMVSMMLAGFVVTLSCAPPASANAAEPAPGAGPAAEALHIPFVENRGQFPQHVAYTAATAFGRAFVTRDATITYEVHESTEDGTSRVVWLRERLAGIDPHPAGTGPSAVRVSYLKGRVPGNWVRRAPAFETITVGRAPDGIALSLEAGAGRLEKVFRVPPGADPGAIAMTVDGAQRLVTTAAGALEAMTPLGPVTFSRPVAYQEDQGVRRLVPVTYRVNGNSYGFDVGAYDPTLPLVIDPVVSATFLGGTAFDVIHDIVTPERTLGVIVAGSTNSSDFPVAVETATGPLAYAGETDGFVGVLSADLTRLIDAVYLGGSGDDAIEAVAYAADAQAIYVAGITTSPDLPLGGPGARPPYDDSCGTDPDVACNDGRDDGFLFRLDAAFTTVQAGTYLGGARDDRLLDLAVASDGNVCTAGYAFSFSIGPFDRPWQVRTAPGALLACFDDWLTQLADLKFVDGRSVEHGNAIALTPSYAFMAGFTGSPREDFELEPNGFDRYLSGSRDGFIARFA